jgi:hypothetical protein
MYEHPISEMTSPAKVDMTYDVLDEGDITCVDSLSIDTNAGSGVARVVTSGAVQTTAFNVWFDFSPQSGKIISHSVKREYEQYVVKHIQSALFYALGNGAESWIPEISPNERRWRNDVDSYLRQWAAEREAVVEAAKKIHEKGGIFVETDSLYWKEGDFKITRSPEEGYFCEEFQWTTGIFGRLGGYGAFLISPAKRMKDAGEKWYLCFRIPKNA